MRGVRPTRRAGRVKRAEIEKIAADSRASPARRDRQRRHHLSQLPRFARTARPLRRAPAGVWTRGTTLLCLLDADPKRRRRPTRELLLPEVPALMRRRPGLDASNSILRCAFLRDACVRAFASSSSRGSRLRRKSDWNALDAEALGYFRTYLRFDTTNPPDNTAAAIAYLKSILDKEGIATADFREQARHGRASSRACPDPPE